MKLREMDVDNEYLERCIFCEVVSDSIECEAMFEVKEQTTYVYAETTNYICLDCLSSLSKKFKEQII